MESAPNLKMAITAGIGSDHVDLQAAIDHKVDVVEVTYCNSRSVAEHVDDDSSLETITTSTGS